MGILVMNITKGKVIKAQKVILYGPEGIGKSTFASLFPNPLFSDTEGSTMHLDVARFDKPTSWPMLLSQIEYVKQNKPCLTYIIDTADWAEKLAKDYLIGQYPKIKSIEDFGYGKGYTMLAEEWGRFLNKLQEVVDAGINVLILAHAMMRKFEQPQELGSYDRWELKLEKKTSPLTKEWADAVLFATYEIHVVNVDNQGATKGKNKAQGGARVMFTSHNPAWDAKNRWGLADKLAFEFKEIALHIPDHLVGPIIETKQVVNEDNAHQNEVQKETLEENVSTDTNNDFGCLSLALQDLLKTDKVTKSELMHYIIDIKGHFPKGTPLENLPQEYTDGALVANWPKVIQEIRNMREPVLDINSDDLPF
ncbi:ATP-binding protein [Erysipelothrix sp. strain 2 (EsS2-7-Brazil)]|nr:ATP-binding protein [Erysipelothrix sp. strain 2 (EsS2-7-Brazil)]